MVEERVITSLSAASDETLLRVFVEMKREEAFAELVRRHSRIVLSVCRSVLGGTADAEDAAQAVFLTLAQKASSRPVHRSLVGWLHRVAWYVAVRAAAARVARRRHEQAAARLKEGREDTLPTDDENPDLLTAIHAGLNQLPEKYRVALLLHHVEGRSQEETAALLGCSVSAASMRLNRGRQMLREKMIRRGAAVTTAGLATVMMASIASGSANASTAFVAMAAKTAGAAAAGNFATALPISGQTLALWKGAEQMLFWAKVKTVAVVVAVSLFTSGVGTVLVTQAATSTPFAFTGTITDVGSGSITVQPVHGGKPVTVNYNSSTVVKVNGKAATADDLKVGMHAGISGQHLSLGNPATEIRAYTPSTSTRPTSATPPSSTSTKPTLFGTITAVSDSTVTIQITGGNQFTVTINDATVVIVSGKTVTAADLKVGMHAGIFGQHLSEGQPATKIYAYMPSTPTPPTSSKPATSSTPPAPSTLPTLAGQITALGSGTVTIQPATGQPITVSFNDATVIMVSGKPATAADLKVGMRAYVIGQNLSAGQPATKIYAYMPGTTTTTTSSKPASSATTPASSTEPTLIGTITEVANWSIAIQPATGNPITVTFNDATVVMVNGTVATAGDLKVGLRAAVYGQHLSLGQAATKIYAYQLTPKK